MSRFKSSSFLLFILFLLTVVLQSINGQNSGKTNTRLVKTKPFYKRSSNSRQLQRLQAQTMLSKAVVVLKGSVEGTIHFQQEVR